MLHYTNSYPFTTMDLWSIGNCRGKRTLPPQKRRRVSVVIMPDRHRGPHASHHPDARNWSAAARPLLP
jgi:hypothetical protein